MERAPSRGHEASPQSGLGVGCKLCSSSTKLHGLSARAQARRISTVDTNVLFAKPAGATGSDLSYIHGVPLAKLPSHTAPKLAVPACVAKPVKVWFWFSGWLPLLWYSPAGVMQGTE